MYPHDMNLMTWPYFTILLLVFFAAFYSLLTSGFANHSFTVSLHSWFRCFVNALSVKPMKKMVSITGALTESLGSCDSFDKTQQDMFENLNV